MSRVSRLIVLFAVAAVPASVMYGGARMESNTPMAEAARAALEQQKSAALAGPRLSFRAERAIILDPATRTARKPTAKEIDEIVLSLRVMTQKIAAQTALQGIGAAAAPVQNIVVARATADGEYETRCVTSFDEAIEFLGLKPENPSRPNQ